MMKKKMESGVSEKHQHERDAWFSFSLDYPTRTSKSEEFIEIDNVLPSITDFDKNHDEYRTTCATVKFNGMLNSFSTFLHHQRNF